MPEDEETPGEQQSRGVRDRMARRLSGDEENAVDSKNDMSAENVSPDSTEQSAWDVESVKDAWNGMTVYLPDHLREGLDDEYRRIDYELGGEVDGDTLKKDRHFKPLLIALGMERMAGMGGDELVESIERMEREELPDRE
jgi:hypothetical protein